MQTQQKTYARHSGPARTDTVSPQEIAAVIDSLAVCIRADGNSDLFGPWAVTRLAAGLGMSVVIAASTDRVEVVREIGEGWAAEFSTALDEDPCRTAEVLRAAMAAIQQVLDEVRKRGLAG